MIYWTPKEAIETAQEVMERLAEDENSEALERLLVSAFVSGHTDPGALGEFFRRLWQNTEDERIQREMHEARFPRGKYG